MQDDRYPIAGEAHIELDGIGADGDRVMKRRQGVLGLPGGCAAVGNDETGVGIEERVQKPAAAP